MSKLYDILINDIQHNPLPLSQFRGKKLLIVNVASECGYTPQYAQLQELYETCRDQLHILACPCNDFGGQEPGSEEAISEFCEVNYGVKFQLTEKITIHKDTHPLYLWLCDKNLNGVSDAKVKWNFSKFLIDEAGNWLASFAFSVSPLDEGILKYFTLDDNHVF